MVYLASQRAFVHDQQGRPDVPLARNLAWPDAEVRAILIAYKTADCAGD